MKPNQLRNYAKSTRFYELMRLIDFSIKEHFNQAQNLKLQKILGV